MQTRQVATLTLQALEEAEEKQSNGLLALLGQFSPVPTPSSSNLKALAGDIKLAVKDFEKASRALSAWHTNHGSVHEASEVRVKRLDLVHTDCREVVRNINSLIRELGDETVSSIGDASRSQVSLGSSSPHEQPEVNDADLYHSSADLSHPSADLSRPSADLCHPSADLFRPSADLCHPSADPIRKVEQYLNRDYSFPKNLRDKPEDVEVLDVVSRRQLRQDLLRGLGEPFSGDPQQFYSWELQLSRRVLEAELGALDSLYALQANTAGRPNRIVSNYIAAGARNPRDTLENVWKELKKRFGADDLVSTSLINKLSTFPIIKTEQNSQMEDLLDLCKVILANMDYCHELQIFNLQRGMKMVWEKMPHTFQVRWRSAWFRHEKENGVPPRFQRLVEAMGEFTDEMTFASFRPSIDSTWKPRPTHHKTLSSNVENKCVYHDTKGHSILDCQAFKRLSYTERKRFASDHRLCFGCLGDHRRANCRSDAVCSICSKNHVTLMHAEREHRQANVPEREYPQTPAMSNCISVCGSKSQKKICSKTMLVDVRAGDSSKKLRCWCILDEQSNTSFCDPKLIQFFEMATIPHTYELTTMSGLKTNIQGQAVRDLKVKGVMERDWVNLPTVLSNDFMPDSKAEIATPELVAKHSHVKQFAKYFPPYDERAEVLLLIGANCGQAMRTESFGNRFPYAHHTAIGWALVGPVCSPTDTERAGRVLRSSTQLCHNEHASAKWVHEKHDALALPSLPNVFLETPDDDLLWPSKDDQKFIDIVSNGIKINDKGNLEMPLPFRCDWVPPQNYTAVYRRAKNTFHRLQQRSEDLQQCLTIMDNYITRDHVEQVPEVDLMATPANYIPTFPVKHPKKSKIRLVFDSAATFQGQSLNNALLQGPDVNNHLVGVLTRFRKGTCGFSADIECMYHSFYVTPEHRDFMRFFWWQDNDPNKPLVPYRAKVHVFGNKSSPSVAIFGLRYATTSEYARQYPAACSFILNNCYVDDALGATDNIGDAITIVKDAQKILAQCNIKLHKISANHPDIIAAFGPDELASELNERELSPCFRRTLGILWRCSDDKFVLRFDISKGKYTKRGLLSTLNSLYDPLGFVSPVMLGGRLLQREIVPPKSKDVDWDDPLPEALHDKWTSWLESLDKEREVFIPRSFFPLEFGTVVAKTLHVFCDASKDAIGYAIYLQSINDQGSIYVSIVCGGSKVAPRSAVSIPRLELCGALEATHAAHYIKQELKLPSLTVVYHCDSRVVLGYLNNTQRRFSKYVTTRIQAILKLSSPNQWQYISTHVNPADVATRAQTPGSLKNSVWFAGPDFLWQSTTPIQHQTIEIDELPETLQDVTTLISTTDCVISPAHHVFRRVSSWRRAKSVISIVHRFCQLLLAKARSLAPPALEVSVSFAETYLIAEAQKDAYPHVHHKLKSGLPTSSRLDSLSPFLNGDVICVGGRLRKSDMPFQEKHPTLLPPKHPITAMILEHFHRKIHHQGRHITMGAMQQAGFHIHHSSSVIKHFLSRCVTCRKLRAPLQNQKMADLPSDRISVAPPFTNTGADVFGPYLTHDSAATRRTKCTKKVWGLLFTCMSSRAIHIESLSSLDITALRLALRRFFAIRGQCVQIRSDQGSNFVGTRNQMQTEATVSALSNCAAEHGCTWTLNPPGASHHGGVWERKIGSVKRILDAAMRQLGRYILSRDELGTLFQEAAAIVNNTPMYGVSVSPHDPISITPAMLLTLKVNPNPPALGFTNADLLSYGKARWRRVQYLADQFWCRWKGNYLKMLQERNRWIYKGRCAKIGDIVLLRQPSPRNSWPMARVTEVKTTNDNLPRVLVLSLVSKDKLKLLQRCVQDTVLIVPNEAL